MDSAKQQIEGDFNGGVNTYEGDVSSASQQEDTATAERIARIRSASQRAKDRIDESEKKAIDQIVKMPDHQQEQLTNVWVEASGTFIDLIGNILGSIVRKIKQLIRGVIKFVKSIFTGARNALKRIFGI